jgi:hypothetical protein
VVHEPKGHLGDLGREFFNFYAVELVHVHADQAVHVHALLACVAAEFMAGAQHGQFQQTQLAVCQHQKVAAATGGVKKAQVAQLLVKLKQAVAVAFDLAKLSPQRIQKQWLDELLDVFFRCVVRAQVAAGIGVHDALEQAAEDGGADGRPVERAGIQQGFAHGGVEVGQGQVFFKQFAVDVREGGQLCVQVRAASAGGVAGAARTIRCVEHLKHLGQACTQVGAIGFGAFFDEGAECLGGLEDAGVVGKQAKQQAYQQHFEGVAFVSAGLQCIVQLAHAVSGFDVDGVLRLYGLYLVPGHEAKELDVFVQVFEGEFERFTGLRGSGQAVHTKALEVAHDDELGQVTLGQAWEVAQGLVKRGIQVFAS